ncbi:MAG: archaeal cell division control protein 6 [Thermoplasmata archaeon]|jgi:cell division control protein 6|nr:archaeal cell division control protein 6 [Thermoplasmata archaeon]
MDPFRALREREPFLTNRSVFSPTYVPADLPGRELDTSRLAGALYPLLQGGAPPNVLIDGPPGCGKSALARYVLHKLKENAELAAIPLTFAHVDGRLVNTHYRLLATLANHLTEGWSDLVPATGWPTRDVHKHLDAHLRERQGRLVVLLDHADALLASAGEDALHDVAGLERVTIVSTLRDERALRRASQVVHAQLAQHALHLDTYASRQVEAILRERAAIGLRSIPSDDVLASIARTSASHAGHALNVLVEASDVVSLRGASALMQEHVAQACARLDKQRARDAFLSASDQERLLLRAISQTRPQEGAMIVTTGDVYRVYGRLAREERFDVLSMRRVTDLVDQLAARGLVHARIISRGRYGRSKEISLLVTPDALQAAIEPAEA